MIHCTYCVSQLNHFIVIVIWSHIFTNYNIHTLLYCHQTISEHRMILYTCLSLDFTKFIYHYELIGSEHVKQILADNTFTQKTSIPSGSKDFP